MDPNSRGENWRPPPPDWQTPQPDWQTPQPDWQASGSDGQNPAPQWQPTQPNPPWAASQPNPPWAVTQPNPPWAASQPNQPWGAPQPNPPWPATEPRRRRRPRWLLLGALVSAVVAVLLGVAAVNQYAEARSPGAVVRSYFQALADGDAPAALAFADKAPKGPFLTSAVLRRQLQAASLSELSILRTTRFGSSATVDLRYRLRFPSGTESVTDSAELIRRGSSWRLSRAVSTVSLATKTAGSDRLSFAGRPLPTAAVTLFPGALPLAADTAGLQVSGQPMVRLADARTTARVEVSLTPQVREKVEQAVAKLITNCLAATSNDPLCPVPDSGRPIPGSVHGQATQALVATQPRIELDGSLIRVRAEIPVRASWKVWDFENQPVQRKGSTLLSVRARLALNQPTKAFWDWSG